MRKRLIIIFVILVSTLEQSVYALTSTVSLKVGETKVLSLSGVSNLKGTQWFTSDPSSVNFTTTPTNYSMSATIKALKYTSLPITIQCTYYYYVNNGKFTYLASGYQAWTVSLTNTDGAKSISISPESATVELKNGSYDCVNLKVTVSPSQDLEYEWKSSNNDVAIPVGSGAKGNGPTACVYIKGYGTASVTATASNGLAASCSITAKAYRDVTISSAGYTTIYFPNNLIVPEGVEVYAYTYDPYTISLCPGTALTEGTIIPERTGFVVKGKPGTYRFQMTKDRAVNVSSDLKGTIDGCSISYFGSGTVYCLGSKDGVISFYKYDGTKIPANKAIFYKSSN